MVSRVKEERELTSVRYDPRGCASMLMNTCSPNSTLRDQFVNVPQHDGFDFAMFEKGSMLMDMSKKKLLQLGRSTSSTWRRKFFCECGACT